MKRGARKESAAALSKEYRLRRLRSALTHFIATFGYDVVRKNLTTANRNIVDKRDNEVRNRQNTNHPDKDTINSEENRYARELQIWLAVEQMRAKLGKETSARAACKALEESGGIKRFRSGDHSLSAGAASIGISRIRRRSIGGGRTLRN